MVLRESAHIRLVLTYPMDPGANARMGSSLSKWDAAEWAKSTACGDAPPCHVDVALEALWCHCDLTFPTPDCVPKVLHRFPQPEGRFVTIARASFRCVAHPLPQSQPPPGFLPTSTIAIRGLPPKWFGSGGDDDLTLLSSA